MNTSSRLRRIRRELDEVSEQLERLASAAETANNSRSELVGSHEVEALVGIPRSTLRTWKRRGLLPAPVAELRCGTVWVKADIEAWLKSRAA